MLIIPTNIAELNTQYINNQYHCNKKQSHSMQLNPLFTNT